MVAVVSMTVFIRLTVLVSNELDALASVHSEAITLLVSPGVVYFASFLVHTGPGGYECHGDQFIP